MVNRALITSSLHSYSRFFREAFEQEYYLRKLAKHDVRVVSLPEAETPVSSPRTALYLRVSTGRQAEHDVSIPDQRTQLNAWCRANGFSVAAEFIEAVWRLLQHNRG